MTARELAAYAGKTGLWTVKFGVRVSVKIWDARKSYGRVDLMVTPVEGSGQTWVDRDSVTDIK